MVNKINVRAHFLVHKRPRKRVLQLERRAIIDYSSRRLGGKLNGDLQLPTASLKRRECGEIFGNYPTALVINSSLLFLTGRREDTSVLLLINGCKSTQNGTGEIKTSRLFFL